MPANQPESEEARRADQVVLLSLDDGGPHGISQLKILVNIMHRISFDEETNGSGNAITPCNVFDMIGGVGTGGLITLFLVVLGMSAEEAYNEFLELTSQVFQNPTLDAHSRTQKLEDFVEDILQKYGIDKNAALTEANVPSPRCKLFVPIMHKDHIGVPIYVRNYRVRDSPPIKITIAQAMVATCATAPNFIPVVIRNKYETQEYVGGGLGLSNPIGEVASEACRVFDSNASISCLLSLGSGHPGVIRVPSDSSGESRARLLQQIIEGSENTSKYFSNRIGDHMVYHRFSVERGLEKELTNKWRDSGTIIAHTSAYLDEVSISNKLEKCIESISGRRTFTNLHALLLHTKDPLSTGSEASRWPRSRLFYRRGGFWLLFSMVFVLLLLVVTWSRRGTPTPVPIPPLPQPEGSFVIRESPIGFLENAIFGKPEMGEAQTYVVITGIPGCGKTELARYIARKYRHLFSTTFWIDGSNEESIRDGITRHVRSLGPQHDQKSFSEALSYLSQPLMQGRRFLVIDNVDSPPNDILDLLPKCDGMVTMITSRNQSLGLIEPDNHLKLDVMTIQESIELLLRASGRAETLLTEQQWHQASIVVEKLGYLPIAVRQAASYMHVTGCSMQEYIKSFEKYKLLLLQYPAVNQRGMRYSTAFAAFAASYDILPPNAQEFLNILSFYHWASFPLDLIALAAEEDFSFIHYTSDSLLESLGSRKPDRDYTYLVVGIHKIANHLKSIFCSSQKCTRIDIDQIVGTLRSQSLITILLETGKPDLIQLHPLLHEWVQSRASPSPTLNTTKKAAIRLLGCGAKASPELKRYLLLHVNHVATFHHSSIEPEEESGLQNITMETHDGSVIFANIGEIIAIQELYFVPNNESYLTSSPTGTSQILTEVSNKGVTLYDKQSPDGRSVYSLQRQLEILISWRVKLGASGRYIIYGLQDIACDYATMGLHEQGISLLVAALTMREERQHLFLHAISLSALFGEARIQSEHDEEVERIFDSLKCLGGRCERFAKTRTVLLKALSLCPGDAWLLTWLGDLHIDMGFYEAAAPLLRDALELRQRNLEVDGPDVIELFTSLGSIYINQGRFRAAEAMLVHALKLRKEVHGNIHPNVDSLSALLGYTYLQQLRYDEAEPFLRDSLGLRKEEFGVYPEATLLGLSGIVFMWQGRYQEAESLIRKSWKLHQGTFAESEIFWISVLLANTYTRLGRYDDAEEPLSQALSLRRRMPKGGGQSVAELSGDMGAVYNRLGRHRDAVPFLMEAFIHSEERLEADDIYARELFHLLGESYFYLGKYEEAEPHLAKALNLYRKGGHYLQASEMTALLAATYERQGRYDIVELRLEETLGMCNGCTDLLPLTAWLAVVYLKRSQYQKAELLVLGTLEMLGKEQNYAKYWAFRFLYTLMKAYTQIPWRREAEWLVGVVGGLTMHALWELTREHLLFSATLLFILARRTVARIMLAVATLTNWAFLSYMMSF